MHLGFAPVALRALPFVLSGLMLGSCSHVSERATDAQLVSPNQENSVAVWPKRSIGTRDRPNARAEWFYGQRAYPQAKIPEGARQKALLQASKIPEVAKRETDGSKASANSLWTPVGPLGFNSLIAPSWGQMSGRVRSIAIDPTNADRLLLGVSTGGVWLSNDGGGNWTPLTDNQPSLVIGAVAFAPSNPQIIYAGTGEGNGSYYSVGILKSTDGGASWNVLGATDFNRAAIAGLLVDPTNPDVVVLCATKGSLGSRGGALAEDSIGGIYRSTDGGQSYTLTANNFCRGLHSVPDDFNVMYHSATGVGAQNGLYRSEDAGQSWSLVSGAVNGEDVQRLAIGLSRDGSRIYIGGQKGEDIVIQRSADGGQSWSDPLLTPLPDSNESAPGNPLTYCESQCDYDNVIAVNPFNPDDVFFGGVGLFRSTDGGATFDRVGENNEPPAPGQNGPLHVDHHALVYHPTIQGLLFNGNDGGIYRTTDGGANWTSLSGTIATLQHYHISLHPTDPNIMFTGNQDNGTTRRSNSNTWTEVAGGDGAFSAVDFTNPQIVFASTTELNILKSTNGGASFSSAGFEREQGEPADFIAPFVMDPVNSQVLYAGTNRLWRTTDSAASWAPISDQLTSNEGATLSYIAVAPSDTSIVYTVASDGTVGRYTPAGGNIVSAAPLPGRYATGVAVSPTDANTVFVSYSGFNSATPDTPGHVFRSTDGGASWTNVSDNLPDAPANAVAIRPDQPNEIYVGTDVGVFISFSGGGSWERMGNGIPNAVIGSLAVNGTTGILAAATYGRSVYTTQLGAAAPGGTTNYSYTYWNPSEPGWGFNAQHQGNLLYGTWYSYDPNTGAPMFLTVEANQTSEGNFAGPVYRVSGTPFELINNAPAFTAVNEVGSAQLVFDGNGALSLSYSLFGVQQNKQLERFTFAANPPTCTGTTASRAGASNYSDLWWNAAEPGWGLTLAHQGNTVFVLWYTYGAGGVDQWFSGSALTLQEDGSFAGALQRPNSGTPLPQINGPATTFPVPQVGLAILEFSNGETGTFSYQVGDVTQMKPIQRFVVVGADQPKPLCVQ